MTHTHETTAPQTAGTVRGSQKRNIVLLILIAGLLLLLVLLSFVPFHVTSSQTEANSTVETGRSGETLPTELAPGFTLAYQVDGPAEFAAAVRDALPEALDATTVGTATAVSDLNAVDGPRLLIVLDRISRVWTPVYGRADITANVYFATDVDLPLAQDEPMVLTESPEIQAKGELTVIDTTWGLLSKPAYYQLLGEALADTIATRLQENIFRPPS